MVNDIAQHFMAVKSQNAMEVFLATSTTVDDPRKWYINEYQ